MALLIEQMKASFPRANYGFAQAIRKGEFKYARGTLGIYNRLSTPAEFYDCATSMRLTVRALRNAGVEADACLLQIPTSGGTDGGSIAQHLVTRLKDKDGQPDLVLGITPYDKLLGTCPYAEVIPGSAVAKLLDSYGQEDRNDDIFKHSQNAAGLLLRIRLPKDVFVLMPEANFMPLSVCQHWGLFGIANLGLFFSESKGTFLLYYSADFWGKGKSEEFPLAMPAQRKIKVEMTPENFALLRREIAADHLDFHGFYRWLQANEHRLTAFVDKVVCPPMSPFLRRAMNKMLADNWLTAALFLDKLPPAVMEQG